LSRLRCIQLHVPRASFVLSVEQRETGGYHVALAWCSNQAAYFSKHGCWHAHSAAAPSSPEEEAPPGRGVSSSTCCRPAINSTTPLRCSLPPQIDEELPTLHSPGSPMTPTPSVANKLSELGEEVEAGIQVCGGGRA